MVNLKDILDPETNPAYKDLVKENPKIEHSMFVSLIIADHYNQVMQGIEVKLKDIKDKRKLFRTLEDIQLKYSNQYAIYGKRVKEDETESVIQLTVKSPSKVLELAKESYVIQVREATSLPKGAYFHISEIPTGYSKFNSLEQEIDKLVSEVSKQDEEEKKQ